MLLGQQADEVTEDEISAVDPELDFQVVAKGRNRFNNKKVILSQNYDADECGSGVWSNCSP